MKLIFISLIGCLVASASTPNPLGKLDCNALRLLLADPHQAPTARVELMRRVQDNSLGVSERSAAVDTYFATMLEDYDHWIPLEDFAMDANHYPENGKKKPSKDDLVVARRVYLLMASVGPSPFISLNKTILAINDPSNVTLIFKDPKKTAEGLTPLGEKVMGAHVAHFVKYPSEVNDVLRPIAKRASISLPNGHPVRNFLSDLLRECDKAIAPAEQLGIAVTAEQLMDTAFLETQLRRDLSGISFDPNGITRQVRGVFAVFISPNQDKGFNIGVQWKDDKGFRLPVAGMKLQILSQEGTVLHTIEGPQDSRVYSFWKVKAMNFPPGPLTIRFIGREE